VNTKWSQISNELGKRVCRGCFDYYGKIMLLKMVMWALSKCRVGALKKQQIIKNSYSKKIALHKLKKCCQNIRSNKNVFFFFSPIRQIRKTLKHYHFTPPDPPNYDENNFFLSTKTAQKISTHARTNTHSCTHTLTHTHTRTLTHI